MKKVLSTMAAGFLLVGSAWAQPYGMGSGMMGGYGGGTGMMGGYGQGGYGYGMGPGMMGGYAGRGDYWGLDLNADQRKKIDQIQEETAKAHWQLMGNMQQQGFHMNNMFGPGGLDETEARKAFGAMVDAQKEMFESSLKARKRIDAILTNEQKEQLRRKWGR